MAVTYTDNLHLGMQLDKNDYLDWDAITDNWRKIDAAYSGGGGGGENVHMTASIAAIGGARSTTGNATSTPFSE